MTTVVGLITDDDESAYKEVHTLTNLCHNNNLSLNIRKTNELVVDLRRQTSEHLPLTLDSIYTLDTLTLTAL